MVLLPSVTETLMASAACDRIVINFLRRSGDFLIFSQFLGHFLNLRLVLLTGPDFVQPPPILAVYKKSRLYPRDPETGWYHPS